MVVITILMDNKNIDTKYTALRHDCNIPTFRHILLKVVVSSLFSESKTITISCDKKMLVFSLFFNRIVISFKLGNLWFTEEKACLYPFCHFIWLN